MVVVGGCSIAVLIQGDTITLEDTTEVVTVAAVVTATVEEEIES
jgi:hypothetical protein